MPQGNESDGFVNQRPKRTATSSEGCFDRGCLSPYRYAELHRRVEGAFWCTTKTTHKKNDTQKSKQKYKTKIQKYKTKITYLPTSDSTRSLTPAQNCLFSQIQPLFHLLDNEPFTQRKVSCWLERQPKPVLSEAGAGQFFVSDQSHGHA